VADEIAGWWNRTEQSPAVEGLSAAAPFQDQLASAHLAELRLDFPAARALLAPLSATVPEGPWQRVLRLLQARLAIVEEPPERAEVALRALVAEIPAVEAATLARAYHLLGTFLIRVNRLAEAEAILIEALSAIDDSLRRTWILDSFGQVLMWRGAWEEARLTLRGVLRLKESHGDPLGTITVGNLAMLELQLGDFGAAAALLEDLLSRGATELPELDDRSRLRLSTLLLQAYLDGNRDETGSQALQLEALLDRIGEAWRHSLKGFAALALARAQPARAPEWLATAARDLTQPDQQILLEYWRARLLPIPIDAAWLQRMRDLFGRAGVVTEGELLTWLLLAERAAEAHRPEETQGHLAAAVERATRSNNRLWIEIVDREFRRLDPSGMSQLLLERFSGRTDEELRRTVLEEATIVFTDLERFTDRSQELAPLEVMQTVRSFFELAVPLLVEHRVRPLSCLGDGLLAICQGDDHRGRGLRFARDVVARAGRMTRVRRSLGNRWGLDLRGGVASGPVVMGVLGNHFKLEFAAIGLTTNLAARLQAQAKPGEVVCALDTAGASAGEGTVEQLTLKGFPTAVAAVRFR
jgi:class 3 adenylate cyclase